MNRILSGSAILMVSFCAVVIDISAQTASRERPLSSHVKIESFDWYSQSEVGAPRLFKNFYGRSQPEGKSANFPTEHSAPDGKAEKFVYRVRVRNLSDREISSVAWRYQFFNPLTGELTTDFEFESRTRIKPNRRKTLYGETFSPPAQVVAVRLLLLNPKQPFKESVTVESLVFAATVDKRNNKRKRK
jgi:hypothetical protein